MPTKFKPSISVRNKARTASTVQHFYMKNTPLEELTSALESSNTQPKVKQKIRNELVRRGALNGN
jgi:hypothetical protein